MANKDTKDLFIKDGIIQYIMPLKLCDRDKEEEVINKLQKSCLIISEYLDEENCIKLKDEYSNSLKTKEENKELLKLFENFKNIEEINLEAALDKEAERINIKNKGEKDTLASMTIQNKFVRESNKILYDFIDDKNLANNYGYKKEALNGKDLLLQPIIILDNDNEYLISCRLSIMMDGYALITLEYKINNIKFNELYNGYIDLNYVSYKIPLVMNGKDEFGFYKYELDLNQRGIMELYLNAINNILYENNLDFEIEVGDIFTFILLADYDKKPTNNGNFSSEYKNNICNLLNAPIYKYNELRTQQINEFFDKSRYIICKYDEVYVSETTRAIYACIGDRSLYLPEDLDKDILYRINIQSVVPAIEVVVLETFIHRRIYNLINEKNYDLNIEDMELINDKILENNLILNNLKKFKFNSMNELLKFIESRQTAGMSKEDIDKDIEIFQAMIKNRKKNVRDENYRKIGMIVGIISLLFSFTSIYSILEIIKKTFKILNDNSIFGWTIFLWLILLFVFVIYFFVPYKKNKEFINKL